MIRIIERVVERLTFRRPRASPTEAIVDPDELMRPAPGTVDEATHDEAMQVIWEHRERRRRG